MQINLTLSAQVICPVGQAIAAILCRGGKKGKGKQDDKRLGEFF